MFVSITSIVLLVLAAAPSSHAFHVGSTTNAVRSVLYSSADADDVMNMATARFPTSPEDQVRQAAIALKDASNDGKKRHSIRLLLPIIGATELDDWPGGARQMAVAAAPLINDVLTIVQDGDSDDLKIQDTVIDESDGVRALFSQGTDPKEDVCAVLLPSADTSQKLQELDGQVGDKRNLLVVNSQWKRKSDFGNSFGFFGGDKREEKINFVEKFEPTFHCSNVMVEGDIVRILRTYPGPWRVYLRSVDPEDETNIEWIEIGTKELMMSKTADWEKQVKEDGDNDGGKLFDYGIPGYREIEDMIKGREGYVPKSLSERASSAFTFIKDTL